MKQDIEESDFIALAELRSRIRRFLRGSDEAAEAAGLEPQQYQLLLALRAIPEQSEATIGRLAEGLCLKHHSVVGMIDRLEMKGYVRRQRGLLDKREVLIVLLPRGRSALTKVVRQRVHELRSSGQLLVNSISAILRNNLEAKNRRREPAKSAAKKPGGTKRNAPKLSASSFIR